MATRGAPLLPARYYVLFCDWLKSVGVNIEQLLKQSRIDANEFFGPDAMLTLEQVDALLDQSFEATGRPDLGFDWGRQIKLSSHDILGYALLSSPTLDYALRLSSRFYRLMTPTFRLSYRRNAEVAEMEFSPVMSMKPQTLRFHIEGISVSVHDQVRILLGGTMPPYDYYVSIAQPAYHQRYRELNPARWHFEAQQTPGMRVALSANLVDRTLEMSDRTALQMAESRCEALLEHVSQGSGLADWVTMMLHEARDGMPTLDDLAHILHITSRTLDRRLRKEGQHFLDIAKQVRHEKARNLLAGGKMSVTQVALQLGYQDVANFTRAFKRDSGMSPTEFISAERK
ncbi:AraC family transcriptional regulator [Sinimarinibacterium sp. CAU 1509]|uniref:AraC family transcriptional regulator n=1 Tax=Sinimarinibacterium sp. CAU 1509 TaxID=2562283 RepID=UPI0010ACE22C|nr:AraC family transcriptional regulator [Sinimarinibacterium sp. CAU 1509]TJY61005.1 AraC family transcriptional regulator [Sinimarinibacterium sp. CAU 1509]